LLHNSEQNPGECPDAAHKPNSGSLTTQRGFIVVMAVGQKNKLTILSLAAYKWQNDDLKKFVLNFFGYL
jgi:hypothetical protein